MLENKRDLPAALQDHCAPKPLLFEAEYRYQSQSFGTNSRRAMISILQTIALPAELPRREPHSIGDARGEEPRGTVRW